MACCFNKLALNVDKTEYMLIGSSQELSNISTESDIEVSIHNKNIKRVSRTKSLGIIIDENLKWKELIDSTSKTVSKTIWNLKICQAIHFWRLFKNNI